MKEFNKKQHKTTKKLALILSAVLLASLSSCIKIEMRESNAEEQVEAEESAPLMLTQATKKYTVESAPEAEAQNIKAEEPREVVTFAVCGDIVMDENIITDAANRASEGKSYSFLKMYTGVYNALSSADIAICTYSAAADENGEMVQSPIESVGAIYDLGIDAVNTDKGAGISGYLEEYELNELLPASDAVILEKNGLNIACLSFDESTSDYSADIEYADFVSDVVMVFVDWNDGTTEAEMKDTVRKIAEAGADVVIGNGRNLGGVEWLDTGDGTLTLAAYSLGHLLAASEDVSGLCGGILSFSICVGNGSIGIEDVLVTPTLIHYTSDEASDPVGYQVFTFDSYRDELALQHAVKDFTVEGLEAYVGRKVKSDFLPSYLRQ